MKVFVSYRRDDSAHAADRIYEELSERFDVVFDVDTIPPGLDYRKHLTEAVAECDVLVALIGNFWLDIENDEGVRRLDDPTDWVRIEIKAALDRDIPVIPVLVGRKSMPKPSEVPKELEDFIFRQAQEVRSGAYFKDQVARLIRAIAYNEQAVKTSQEQAVKSSESEELKQERVGRWQNALGMDFARIPAGTFAMGSEENDSEQPVHPVTISRSFYLGTTVVTQGQWKAVMGAEPWKGESYVQEGDAYPAVYVSWEDAQAFIKKLNGQDDASRYRLPSEAEWEYACRAGSTTAYSFGDDASELGEYAWYFENADEVGEEYAHRVGQKRSNAWGLYDMHGNVWEWVEDWFGDYPSGAVTDPTGPATGSSRVLRGGSFGSTAGSARSAHRSFDPPGIRGYGLGFRLVRMAL